MMKIYKNIKTGTIIHSPCVLQGLNWIEITKEAEEAKEKPRKTTKDVK